MTKQRRYRPRRSLPFQRKTRLEIVEIINSEESKRARGEVFNETVLIAAQIALQYMPQPPKTYMDYSTKED